MPHIKLRTDIYGITSLLDYRKETAAPLCALTDLLLRGDSTLTESERELIAAWVSYLSHCRFCFSAHSTAACLLPGGDSTQIEKMKKDITSMDVSDKMHALLSIAGKVQQSGKNVQQSDIDEARLHGATDLEIHDTVLIAAVFCLYNRYVDGLDTATPDDPAFYQALGKRITSRGYSMPADGYHPLQVGVISTSSMTEKNN
ncbi:MAG TPA: hypothetical protein VI603_12600 [Saprospiraceae bacterium]|nr:hypothetical protein [Saprospiraceae bacterium]